MPIQRGGRHLFITLAPVLIVWAKQLFERAMLTLRSASADRSLQPAVIEALRSAGATEEMIAAAVKAAGEFPIPHPIRGGRPRKYADRAARDRAYRAQKKPRVETPPRV
jgi:hypothetical protein